MLKPIKIIVAGDLLPSENNYPLFERGDAEYLYGKEICRLFAEADFSIANLEGPLTDTMTAQVKDGPGIKTPKATIAGIKNLGISALALANNHITDFLQQGIDDTCEVLTQAGIQYLGIVSKEVNLNGNKYLSVVLGGWKVCFYNVSETFFNRPTNDCDGANVYDEWIVLNEIKDLRQRHDFLIVIYHGGAEYLPYPTPQTRTRFLRMAECGADFITAQHTHCIGCEEWYNGSYLLYGQGNFLFARQKKCPSLTKEGLLSEITISDNGSFLVKNHKIIIDNNVVRYDEKQDLSSFLERSKRVDDTDYIIKQYQQLKMEEIMPKYLLAAKGSFPFQRIIYRLFPSSLRHPDCTYNCNQILRNYNVMQSERRGEDMYYVWKYLLENKRNGKQ